MEAFKPNVANLQNVIGNAPNTDIKLRMDRIKIFFIYISVGLSFLNFRGQQIGNYLSNGSFENLYDCNGQSLLKVKNWLSIDSIGYGAAFMSTCNNKVPWNANTYQIPRTGNTYMLSTLYWYNNGRGYLKNRLKATLQLGKVYCVKFYVNIANTSPFGMDGFGIFFGNNTIDTITLINSPLSYLSPQVKNPIGSVIKDTLNWVSITGTFVANGTEKYALLGNFLADNAITTGSIGGTHYPQNWTDVCIDDVSCIELNLPAFAGSDKVINIGDSTFIGRQSDFAIDPGCIWYKLPNMTTSIDTISGLWVKPTTTTTYVVRQQLDCSPLKWDTVVVTINTNLVDIAKIQWFSDNISLFPIPTSDNLNISFPSQLDIQNFNISNSLGQIIREEEIEIKNASYNIQTSDLKNGIYQIHFKTQFGVVTKKFVKTN